MKDPKLKKFPDPSAFENVEYIIRITGTVDTDPRIMTFVNVLWGIEVTGGIDQYEPLTVIGVKRSGLARRAGIRVNDIITRINDTPANNLTLMEALRLIRDSGKFVRIYVRGDDNDESDDEFTVDFWFTPPKPRPKPRYNKWNGTFPWNDRAKPIYKESNCYMVPSIAVERIKRASSQARSINGVEETIETTEVSSTNSQYLNISSSTMTKSSSMTSSYVQQSSSTTIETKSYSSSSSYTTGTSITAMV